MKVPFVSRHRQIRIRPTSNTLSFFNAVTKDAIPIIFKEVEVITSVPRDNVIWLNRKFGDAFRSVLVFDRLKEEIRRHCFANEIVSLSGKFKTCFFSLLFALAGPSLQ